MTTRPRTSKRKRPKEELKIVFQSNRYGEHTQYLKGPGAALQKKKKNCKTMPSGNSKPSNSLGRLPFSFFPCPHPSLRGKRRNSSARDLRARGRSIWPEAARSGEMPAAIMAPPSCRGHFTTQFSRRGAHSPPTRSSHSRTPRTGGDKPQSVQQPRTFSPQSPARPAAES